MSTSLLQTGQTHDGSDQNSPEVPSDDDSEETGFMSNVMPILDDLQTSVQFIHLLENACLDNDPLPDHIRDCLCHPTSGIQSLDDPDLRLSIDLYLATGNASEETYRAARNAILRRFPDVNILSYEKVKQKIEELTGVISIVTDMCPKSCLAYTGPFADLEHCPLCHAPRYDQVILASSKGKRKVPLHQFHTMPVGPQLWAIACSKEQSQDISYTGKKMTEIL